jgi:hypothetical protein
LVGNMKVFISHAASDGDFARRLAALLSKAGLEVWSAEEKLALGDNWALEIGQALEASDAMVVLVSPKAMQSQWVQNEIQFAIASEKFHGRFFPILLQPTPDAPWIFQKLEYIKSKDPRKASAHIIRQLQDTAKR